MSDPTHKKLIEQEVNRAYQKEIRDLRATCRLLYAHWMTMPMRYVSDEMVDDFKARAVECEAGELTTDYPIV